MLRMKPTIMCNSTMDRRTMTLLGDCALIRMSFVVKEGAVIFGLRVILVCSHQLEAISGGETLLRVNQFKAKALRPVLRPNVSARGSLHEANPGGSRTERFVPGLRGRAWCRPEPFGSRWPWRLLRAGRRLPCS